MGGWIDLHCHYVGGIDDGARSLDDSYEMVTGLHDLGFRRVVATPHMRPGLFDNEKDALMRAFSKTAQELQARVSSAKPQQPLPELSLACEHYFDDVVYQRLLSGQGIPYPGNHAVLLEFYEIDFPLSIDHQLARLSRSGITPVIAHPERYRAIWRSPEVLERLLDSGAVALLDAAALVGKYGKRPQHCAEQLLESGLYHAACSDAHRPADVGLLALAMDLIGKRYGNEELSQLFETGPAQILGGTIER